jgi:hypothetical protein
VLKRWDPSLIAARILYGNGDPNPKTKDDGLAVYSLRLDL